MNKQAEDFKFFSLNQFIFPKNQKSNKPLGKGSFATVHLVIYDRNYEKDLENVKKEITFHRELFHPNIIKLYDFFYDKQKIYLILEYAPNGNLFTFLRRNISNIPKEKLVHLFLQIASAVKYIHDYGIIHRDLKPENILLDSNYNAKLCDFGWSTHKSKENPRTTFCGTYEYMAPEIFESKPYDYTVDIWSLGIFLYELFHGYSPFADPQKGNSVMAIYKKVQMNLIKFKKDLDSRVKSLITHILHHNPRKRLSLNKILTASVFTPYLIKFNEPHLIIDPRIRNKRKSLIVGVKNPKDDLINNKKKRFLNKNKEKEFLSKSKSPNVLITSKRFQKKKNPLFKPNSNTWTSLKNKSTIKEEKFEEKKSLFKKKINEKVESSKRNKLQLGREEAESHKKSSLKTNSHNKKKSIVKDAQNLLKRGEKEENLLFPKKKISLQNKEKSNSILKKASLFFGKKLKIISNKSINGSLKNTENSISVKPSKDLNNTDQKDSLNRKSKNSSIKQINKQFNVNSEKINNKILSNHRRNKNKSINFSKVNMSETSGRNTPSINLSQKIIYNKNFEKTIHQKKGHDRSKTDLSRELFKEQQVIQRESDPNLSSLKKIVTSKKDLVKNYKITFDQNSSLKCFSSIKEEKKESIEIKEKIYSCSSNDNKEKKSNHVENEEIVVEKSVNSKKESSRTLKTRSFSSNLNQKGNSKKLSNFKNSFQNSHSNLKVVYSDINNVIDYSSSSINNENKSKVQNASSLKQNNIFQKMKRIRSPKFLKNDSKNLFFLKQSKFFKTDSFVSKNSLSKYLSGKGRNNKNRLQQPKTPNHIILPSSPFMRKILLEKKSENFSKFISPKNKNSIFKSQNDNKIQSKEKVIKCLLSKEDESLSFNLIPSLELKMEKIQMSLKRSQSFSPENILEKFIPMGSFKKITIHPKKQIQIQPENNIKINPNVNANSNPDQKNIFKFDKSSDSNNEGIFQIKNIPSSKLVKQNSVTPEFVKITNRLEQNIDVFNKNSSNQILFKDETSFEARKPQILTSLNELIKIPVENKNSNEDLEIENNYQTNISNFNNKIDFIETNLNKSEKIESQRNRIFYTKKTPKQKTRSNYNIEINSKKKSETLSSKNKSSNLSNHIKKYLTKEKFKLKNKKNYTPPLSNSHINVSTSILKNNNLFSHNQSKTLTKNLELSRSYNSEYADIDFESNQVKNLTPNAQTFNVYNENNLGHLSNQNPFFDNQIEENYETNLQQSNLILNQKSLEENSGERETTHKYMKTKRQLQTTKEIYDRIKFNEDNISSQTINSRKKFQKKLSSISPIPQTTQVSTSLNNSKIKLNNFIPNQQLLNFNSVIQKNNSKKYDSLKYTENKKASSQKLNIKNILNYQSSFKDDQSKKYLSFKNQNAMASSDGFNISKTFQNIVSENSSKKFNKVSQKNKYCSFTKKNLVSARKDSIEKQLDPLIPDSSFQDNKIDLFNIINLKSGPNISSNNSSQNSISKKYLVPKSRKKNLNYTDFSKSLSSQNISFSNKLSKTIYPKTKNTLNSKMISFGKRIPPQLKAKNLYLKKNESKRGPLMKPTIQDISKINFVPNKKDLLNLKHEFNKKGKKVSSKTFVKSKTPLKKIKNFDLKIPKYEFTSQIIQKKIKRKKFDSKIISREKNYVPKKSIPKKQNKNFNSHNVSIKNNTLQEFDKNYNDVNKEYHSINPENNIRIENINEFSKPQNEISKQLITKNFSHINSQKKKQIEKNYENNKVSLKKRKKFNKHNQKNFSKSNLSEMEINFPSKDYMLNSRKNYNISKPSLELESASSQLFEMDETSNIYFEKYFKNKKKNNFSKTNLDFKDKKIHFDSEKLNPTQNYSNIYELKNSSNFVNNSNQTSFNNSQSGKNRQNTFCSNSSFLSENKTLSSSLIKDKFFGKNKYKDFNLTFNEEYVNKKRKKKKNVEHSHKKIKSRKKDFKKDSLSNVFKIE